MIGQIGDLLPRLRVYEALFPNHERLVQTMSLIYCDLLGFCLEAKDALRKPKRALMKITWKTFEARFGKLVEQFTYNRDQVAQEAEMSHLIESADAHESIRAVQLQTSEDRRSQSLSTHFDKDRLSDKPTRCREMASFRKTQYHKP